MQLSSGFRPLLGRTFRSYTRKERLFSAILVGILFLSFLSFIPSWTGKTLAAAVYSEGFVGQFKRLNPLFGAYNEVDQDVSRLVFSGLTKYDPVTQSFVPDLATYTMSDDGLTYTFIMRDGIEWHDGMLFTAADVFFTYHDVLQSAAFSNPVLQQNFAGVNVTLIDPKTVSFTLTEPNTFFIANTTLGILPTHLLRDIAVEELSQSSFNQSPIGTGPFRLDGTIRYNTDDSSEVILERFDAYYGEQSALETIHFYAFSSYDDLLDSLGFLRGIGKLHSLHQEDFVDAERFQLLSYTLPQYTGLFFNTDQPILKRKQVRLALLKAIDKQAVLDAVGSGQMIDTPLLQLDQNAWLHQPNVIEAQGALYDAGWRYITDTTTHDGEVRRNSADEPLVLTLLARSYEDNVARATETKAVLDVVTQAWSAIGVEVDVILADAQTFATKVSTRDYDVLFTGQSLGYNLDTYAYWHSSQAASPSAETGAPAAGLNFANYRNADADFLIEGIRKVPQNGDAQKTLLEELAKTIDGDVPAVFLYTPSYTFVIDHRVQGISVDHLAVAADRFASVYAWTIE